MGGQEGGGLQKLCRLQQALPCTLQLLQICPLSSSSSCNFALLFPPTPPRANSPSSANFPFPANFPRAELQNCLMSISIFSFDWACFQPQHYHVLIFLQFFSPNMYNKNLEKKNKSLHSQLNCPHATIVPPGWPDVLRGEYEVEGDVKCKKLDPQNLKTLLHTNYPIKPGENHFRNHLWPLKSGFSAIIT